MKQLNIPTTIVIASLIIGGSIYGVQVQKQNSIEKQQRIEIASEEKKELNRLLAEEKKIEDAKLAEEEKETKLNGCLRSAYTIYSTAWRDKCETLGILPRTCKTLEETNGTDYADERADEETNIDLWWKKFSEYYDRLEDECTCGLSSYQYDIIEERYATGKDECYKKFK